MKRTAVILIFLLTGAAAPLFALEEFTRVRPPNPEQLKVMAGLAREIAETQRKLELFRVELENKSCGTFYGGENIYCEYYTIDQQTQRSIVPLTAQQETIYGQRQRYILNEQAIIQWNGPKIVSFTFESRRGFLGKGQVLWKRLSGNSITDLPEDAADDAPLNLVVDEILTSGQGKYVNFRFPDQPDVRDTTEEIEVNGQKKPIEVVYVRDPATKIRMMREYLRQLKLLEHRLDWNIRSEAARRAAEVERYLRSNYDR